MLFSYSNFWFIDNNKLNKSRPESVNKSILDFQLNMYKHKNVYKIWVHFIE